MGLSPVELLIDLSGSIQGPPAWESAEIYRTFQTRNVTTPALSAPIRVEGPAGGSKPARFNFPLLLPEREG
jgi:hypothetical protein